jgi:alpha-L-rhamnosidase
MLIGDLYIWMNRYLAGIRPDPQRPGYKHIMIHPILLGDLQFVRAWRECPYGRIVSHWKREGDTLIMNVTIPANTTATVYVPARDASQVTEEGKPAGQAEGVKFIRMEGDAAVFEVGAGQYNFKSNK